MPRRKPTVFIGSAKESKDVAIAFMKAIADSGVAHPVGWWNAREFGVFGDTLSALLEASENYDYGLFILGKDDFTISREKDFLTPRDNVFVEMGIFLGKLGPKRVLAAVYEPAPDEPPLKTPTDFAGRHIPRFRYGNEDQMRASVDIAAAELIAAMRSWLPEERMPLLKGTTHEPIAAKFTFGINTETLELRKKRIGDRWLVPVILKDDSAYPWPENPIIAVGQRRKPPEVKIERWDLIVEAPDFQKQLNKGDQLEFRLFLGPTGISKADAKTINDLFEEGCVFVDGGIQAARGGGWPNPTI